MSTYAPAPPTPLSTAAARARARAGALVRGREGDPRWVRPGLLAVLAMAAALCLWDLTASGWSNTYYAAAARAGSESWNAWFFGAIDPGSFITVDKPPLSLWIMGLSARAFGFSSFSILLPQALETIAAVGLLFATVRRAFGPAAGLLAAGALALTPVTVAIARVNNPDALLVLLLVGAAYLLQRALASGRTKPLLWCGVLVGLAFMTKMLAGWMIVPGLVAAYALAGPPRLGRRLGQLAAAGAAMVAVSAAWPVAVALWPGSTPYIGGSTDGSVWNLIFGYNGFGRLTGSGDGGGGMGFGGSPGLLRLLNEQVGGQIGWLLPLAAVSLVGGLWATRRAARTDRARAAWVMWGGWAVVLAAVFSTQQGIFHPYYVSALAPAIAALCGAGLVAGWSWARRSWVGLGVAAATLAAQAGVAVMLLGRTASFAPALRWLVPLLAAGAIGGAVLVRLGAHPSRRVLAAVAVAGVLALGVAPAAYSLATAGRSLNGNNVLAGPAGAASAAGGPGMGGGPPAGARRSGAGGPPRAAGAPSAPRGAAGGMGGGASATLVRYLEAHQGSAKYLVAVSGSQSSAAIIIDTGKAVVTMGGFNGGDPAPTVGQLKSMLRSGQLKYVLVSSGGPGGGPGRSAASSSVSAWVKAHLTAVPGAGTASGQTLFAWTAAS